MSIEYSIMNGEEVIIRGKKYLVTSLDKNGKVNGLKRFNEKTKMWVTISFY